MEQEHFPVRPFGKYGHTYFLDRKHHRLYWGILISLLVLVIGFGQIEIIGSQRYSDWPLSQNLFFLLILAIFLVGIHILFRVASRGQIAPQEFAFPEPTSAQTRIAKVTLLLMSMAGGILFGIFCFAIFLEFKSHRSVRADAIVISLIVLYSSIQCYRKSRK